MYEPAMELSAAMTDAEPSDPMVGVLDVRLAERPMTGR